MARHIIREVKKGTLSAGLVEEFCNYTTEILSKTKLSQKDILRFRISVDTAMCAWLDELGEGAECTFEYSRRFGRVSIAVTCEGKKCNPQQTAYEEFGNLQNSSLLQSLGLTVGYSYENGVNRIKLMPNSGFILKLLPIIIALVLGVGLGLLLKYIDPEMASELNNNVVDPVCSALMSILRAIASPLIFLAVLSGIYGIGDVASLGTIGKKLLGRFGLMTFLALIINFLILLPIIDFEFGQAGATGGSIREVLDLVLQFVPSDIVSPFLNGNMLQVITLSVACGLVMLILGERVTELTHVVDQLYSVVQLLMEAIGHMVPVFIFMNLFTFVLADNDIEVMNIIQPIIGTLGVFVVMGLIVYPVTLMVKYRISYPQLMKKMLPTFIIAFTTASSAAAFSSNVETCEKELGISSNVTKFGVPLGQVVFMPIAAAEYFSLSIILAGMWDVKISVVWIITALLVSGILSIATPPIPGGAISIFTVLFLQLGIPTAALPIALGIDLLLDYMITAGDIMCLQEELIICADKTGHLDKEKLLKKIQ